MLNHPQKVVDLVFMVNGDELGDSTEFAGSETRKQPFLTLLTAGPWRMYSNQACRNESVERIRALQYIFIDLFMFLKGFLNALFI